VFATSGILAWRNVNLRRGDRRGAFRIGLLLFVAHFSGWLARASHVADITEASLVFAAIPLAGFFAFGFWTIYLAFEPYVRRRWPHTLVSWTRLIAGKLTDPVVASHLLTGAAAGATMATLSMLVVGLAVGEGLRLPSAAMLSGPAGIFVQLAATIEEGFARALSVFFFTFFSKVFFRSEWVAVLFIALLAPVFEPGLPVPASTFSLITAPIAFGFVYLALHSGLVAVMMAICTFGLLIQLPVMADLSAPGTPAAVLMLFGLAAWGLFCFRSAVAGRRLLPLDL
jgi:hypothetical protein